MSDVNVSGNSVDPIDVIVDEASLTGAYSAQAKAYAELAFAYKNAALAAQQAAEAYATQAAAKAGDAESSAELASAAAQASESASQLADAARVAAGVARDAAQAAATAAAEDAGLAHEYAQDAEASKNAAALSATAAATSARSAAEAATSATAAKVSAESAKAGAEAAALLASTAKADATAAAQDAERFAQESMDNAEKAFAALPTETVSAPIASIDDGADGIPVKALTVQIVAQQPGSGDPSPDNIRPISGWTGVTIQRVGRNLFNKNNFRSFKGYVGNIPTGTFASYTTGRDVIYFRCKPGQTYTASRPRSVTNERLYICFSIEEPAPGVEYFNARRAEPVGNVGDMMSITATAPDDSVYVCVWGWWESSVNPQDALQIEFGPTASAYEPYEGDAYPISWESEAGIVYGGTLDVTTGLLTVNRGKKVFDGSENGWTANGTFGVAYDINGFRPSASLTMLPVADYLTSRPQGPGSGLAAWQCRYNPNGTHFLVRADAETSASVTAWKAYLAEHPLTVLFGLSSPVTYQLTPTEVTTLLGVNSIRADTGDSAVTYRADVGMYVDKRIAALMTALG